jgi:hypothetical protein
MCTHHSEHNVALNVLPIRQSSLRVSNTSSGLDYNSIIFIIIIKTAAQASLIQDTMLAKRGVLEEFEIKGPITPLTTSTTTSATTSTSMTRWGSTATVTLAQSQKSTFSLAY